MEDQKCVVCKAQMQNDIVEWLHVCKSCRYERSTFLPAINSLAEHDSIDENEREAALKHIRVENFTHIINRLKQYIPLSGRKLLDVGAAHGWFLEQSRTHFDVLGIEPDVNIATKAASCGLPVRIGYFPHALALEELFDVIVFNDVIEHIPDIKGTLQEVHRHLSAKGWLVLNLPSSTGSFYKIAKFLALFGIMGPFERLWQKGMPSPHVHYFREANLAQLARAEGFDVVEHFELPALTGKNLMQRIRYAGKGNYAISVVQYVVIKCAIPILRVLPSDIFVLVLSKR